MRVVVQGSGNVGGVSALLLHREGYKVVSLSDMYGTIHAESGLDVPAVLAWLEEHKRLDGYADAEHLDNRAQLELECDVLVPAATENQITSTNVDQIRARVILEGANGPTTAPADRALEDRGVMVVPDILANAGGVTVSYFEWVQDRIAYFWGQEEVDEKMEKIMVNSFADVAKMADAFEVSQRIAAYMLAIDRVSQVARVRGIYA